MKLIATIFVVVFILEAAAFPQPAEFLENDVVVPEVDAFPDEVPPATGSNTDGGEAPDVTGTKNAADRGVTGAETGGDATSTNVQHAHDDVTQTSTEVNVVNNNTHGGDNHTEELMPTDHDDGPPPAVIAAMEAKKSECPCDGLSFKFCTSPKGRTAACKTCGRCLEAKVGYHSDNEEKIPATNNNTHGGDKKKAFAAKAKARAEARKAKRMTEKSGSKLRSKLGSKLRSKLLQYNLLAESLKHNHTEELMPTDHDDGPPPAVIAAMEAKKSECPCDGLSFKFCTSTKGRTAACKTCGRCLEAKVGYHSDNEEKIPATNNNTHGGDKKKASAAKAKARARKAKRMAFKKFQNASKVEKKLEEKAEAAKEQKSDVDAKVVEKEKAV